MTHSKNLATIIALMVTIIIDIMGIGLVFPVLPSLFYSDTQAIVASTMSLSMRNFLYGVCLTAWPLGIFFGAPYLGDLSDKLSRKKVILICLGGMVISNALSGIAVHAAALSVFIFGRFLAGFFSGSFPIAQAAMVDMSDANNKARSLSLVTLAASMGFAVGPLITSVSTLPACARFFDNTTPFYVATLLSLFNFIGVWRWLPDNTPLRPSCSVHFFRGILVIRDILQDLRTRQCLIAFLFMFFGWGLYFSNLPPLLARYFHYSTSLTALIFVVFALGNIAGILVLQPVLLRLFSLRQCCVYSAVALAFIVTLSTITVTAWMQWIVAFCAPAVQVVLYTAVMTLLSNAVTPAEQGRVMGGADAAMSVAFMLSGLCLGEIMTLHFIFPVFLAGLAILLSALFFRHERQA